MRLLARLLLLFLVAAAAMSIAYWSGFVTANRVRDVVLAARPDAPFASVIRATGGSAQDIASGGSADGEAATGGDPEVAAAVDSEHSPGSPAGGDPAPSGDAAPNSEANGAPASFDLFWEALDVVQSEFDGGAPDLEDVTFGAIRGSLRSLDDPFTLFSDPVDTAVQSPQLDGEFEGIGAYVTSTPDGRVMIQTPMRGQPAEKAGVMAGDIIVKVDDVDITGLDLSEAVLLIRGPKGTTVELTILREGSAEPIVIPVVRDRIEIPSVDGVTLLGDRGAPNVGYIQLTVFAAETADELVGAIEELREGGAEAIILDLRNNPGGFLNTAIDVASEFVDTGVIVYQEDSRGKRTAMDARSGGHATDLPLVVLVNRGSASASEIVAGAIRDHDRGVLVGQKTFGKGSVQNVHQLSDGSELRVTVAVWLTPDGNLIHKTGIAPDVLVEPDAATAGADEAGGTADSDAADASDGAADDAAADGGPPADRQLERAIEEALRLVGRGS